MHLTQLTKKETLDNNNFEEMREETTGLEGSMEERSGKRWNKDGDV